MHLGLCTCGLALLMAVGTNVWAATVTNSSNNNYDQQQWAQQQAAMQLAAAQAKHDDRVAESRRQLLVAQGEQREAEAALSAAVARCRSQFESSAEYRAALVAQKTAQDEYDKIAKPILAKVADLPAYREAAQKREQVQAELKDCRGQPGSAEKAADLAKQSLELGSVCSKLEAAALAGDPAIPPARTKLVEATKKVAELRKQFEESIKTNADCTAAKGNLDSAKQKVTAANKTLAENIAKPLSEDWSNAKTTSSKKKN